MVLWLCPGGHSFGECVLKYFWVTEGYYLGVMYYDVYNLLFNGSAPVRAHTYMAKC